MIDYNLKTWQRTTQLLRDAEQLWQELLLKEMESNNG